MGLQMTITRKRRKRAAKAGFLARLRHPGGAWIAAVLALVFQLGLSASHAAERASASPAELAAAALGAALGQQIVLCDQAGSDHADPHGHSSPCCDDCALCGVACHAAALAPRLAALLAPQPLAIIVAFRLNTDEAAPSRFNYFNARPRAPPLSI
jgi:hypothetical protein